MAFIFPYCESHHPNWIIFFRRVAQPPTRYWNPWWVGDTPICFDDEMMRSMNDPWRSLIDVIIFLDHLNWEYFKPPNNPFPLLNTSLEKPVLVLGLSISRSPRDGLVQWDGIECDYGMRLIVILLRLYTIFFCQPFINWNCCLHSRWWIDNPLFSWSRPLVFAG